MNPIEPDNISLIRIQISEYIQQQDITNEQFQSIKNMLEKLQKQYTELIEITLDVDFDKSNFLLSLDALSMPSQRYFRGGTLLSLANQCELNNFFKRKEQVWKLIYKGTRDGFTQQQYQNCHRQDKCVLFVIQSKKDDGRPGYLFGQHSTLFVSDYNSRYYEDEDESMYAKCRKEKQRRKNVEIAETDEADVHHSTFVRFHKKGEKSCITSD